jgi:hypothetical protein
LNWTQILKDGGVPEPPGRPEVIKQIEDHPYQKPVRKAKAKKR